MDPNGILQAITSVGFPIVACCALFWQNYRLNEYHRQESEEMREAINELKIAVMNLTTTLKKDQGL